LEVQQVVLLARAPHIDIIYAAGVGAETADDRLVDRFTLADRKWLHLLIFQGLADVVTALRRLKRSDRQGDLGSSGTEESAGRAWIIERGALGLEHDPAGQYGQP